MSSDDISDNIKEGSDSIIEGLGRVSIGFQHLLRSLGLWFDTHPRLKWVILAPVSAVAGNFIIQLLNQVYVYFFGATAVISRDVMLEVFPAPVGFTLWILLVAFLLFGIISYFKIVTLRQRIEELEKRIQD